MDASGLALNRQVLGSSPRRRTSREPARPVRLSLWWPFRGDLLGDQACGVGLRTTAVTAYWTVRDTAPTTCPPCSFNSSALWNNHSNYSIVIL